MIQLNFTGIKLWENIIFVHFFNYPLHGTKKIKLNKLLDIKKLQFNNNHIIKIGKLRRYKPEYVLNIKKIWES
jgi:hypothetical protein